MFNLCSDLSPCRYSYLLVHCLGPSTPHLLLLPLHPAASHHLQDPSSPTSPLHSTTPPLLLDPLPPRSLLASSLAWPALRLVTIPLGEGRTAQARLVLPPGLDPTEMTRYPVVLALPSEPALQRATTRWRADLSTLVAARGAVVLEVDGRGSGGRGEGWREGLRGEVGRGDLGDHLGALRSVL